MYAMILQSKHKFKRAMKRIEIGFLTLIVWYLSNETDSGETEGKKEPPQPKQATGGK